MGWGVLDPERGFLNKWEMYKALQGEDIGPCQLPVTALFNEQSLQQMLRQYLSVYVKPVDSWGGRDISRVDAKGNNYVWTVQGQEPRTYATLAELSVDLAALYQEMVCVVQQTAPLSTYQKRPFDIRVHMQRELDETWLLAGTLARIAGDDAIVSNIGISKGYVLPVEPTITVALSLQAKPEPQRVQQLEQHLAIVGYKICHLLDHYRAFNEVGIDLGVDQQGGLWLIEVNTDDALGGPSHELFAQLPDQTIYQQMEQRTSERRLQMIRWLFGLLDEKE